MQRPTAPEEIAAEVWSVSKHFHSHVALRSVSLRVRAGEVLALTGPNGAGKTTLVSLMLGLSKPTYGRVRVCGVDADDPVARRRVGGMIHGAAVPPGLRVAEVLGLFRTCFAAPLPHRALMALTGLAPKLDRCAGNLSAGERQRLLIGLALMGDPQLAILDEPCSSLDGAGREVLYEAMRDLAQRKRAVIFTTHQVEEARAVANRVLTLIDGGLSCSSR